MWDPTPLNWSRLCGIGLAKTGVRYVGRNTKTPLPSFKHHSHRPCYRQAYPSEIDIAALNQAFAERALTLLHKQKLIADDDGLQILSLRINLC